MTQGQPENQERTRQIEKDKEPFVERAISAAEACPNCGLAGQVSERMVTEWFDYGNVRHAFQARFPVLECNSCSFGWRDHRSEAIIDAAMDALVKARGWHR